MWGPNAEGRHHHKAALTGCWGRGPICQAGACFCLVWALWVTHPESFITQRAHGSQLPQVEAVAVILPSSAHSQGLGQEDSWKGRAA